MLAAFALEAATSHLNQRPAATKLIEWGCRQVRRNMPPAAEPGEFERRWHLAAFASLSGAIDPDALEAHTAHVKLQFPRNHASLRARRGGGTASGTVSRAIG